MPKNPQISSGQPGEECKRFQHSGGKTPPSGMGMVGWYFPPLRRRYGGGYIIQPAQGTSTDAKGILRPPARGGISTAPFLHQLIGQFLDITNCQGQCLNFTHLKSRAREVVPGNSISQLFIPITNHCSLPSLYHTMLLTLLLTLLLALLRTENIFLPVAFAVVIFAFHPLLTRG